MPLNGKTKHEVLTAFRYAEILDAARRVFARTGFRDSSVEAIAQEAGVAKGTLYLYYKSKNEIYWEALKNGLLGLGEELRAEVERAETPRDKVRAYIGTKLSYFDRHRDFFKIYYAEFANAISHPTYFHKDFQDLYLEQLRLLKVALADGLREQLIRHLQPDAVAFAIFDLTRGAITHRLLGDSSSTIAEEIEFLCDFTWKGIARQ
jgi:AcrR family transcriptional regulator